MRQNLVIFLVLLALLALGLWGQYELSPTGFRNDFPQVLYNTLTLFALEGEWTAGVDLNWQLQLTRFLAPLASIAGVLFVLTHGAWVRLGNQLLRLRQQHVVVAGLGPRSWQFVQSCHEHYKVVVVEIDAENPAIENARKLGIPVLVGDILNPAVYAQVNLPSAEHLVLFTGNDGINVEATIKARNFLKSNSADLRIHVHADDARISTSLQNYPKFYGDASAVQISFFSVYELNARLLFQQYPPEQFAYVFNTTQVHLAIHGFSRQAQAIVLEAVRCSHYANRHRVRVTIFDSQAEVVRQQLFSDHPDLPFVCDLQFLTADHHDTFAFDVLSDDLLQSITEHIVCFPTDAENLQVALGLRSSLLNRANCNSPILVRMQQSSGLAQLLESNHGGPEIPDGLFPFGMLDEVLHHDNILADGLDKMAQIFHEDYLIRRGDVDADHRLYSTLNTWLDLPEPERQSNRLLADHLATKLRAVGCRLTDSIDSRFAFSDEEATRLAIMEHSRWAANREILGWRHGPERIESAKIHPFLGTWQELPEAEQQAQIDAIKRYPTLLASRTGQGLQREVRIGITGHRLHKLNPDDPQLIADIDRALQALVKKYAGSHLILISPLAEGADRVVARMATEKYGMHLHVILPLPYELYQSDFTSAASNEEFMAMVGLSEAYYELPMKFGNQENLTSRIDGQPNPDRNRQYALAGAYLVQNCDELLAIYDGEPAAGEGGVGQVVEWREAGQTDSIYQHSSDFFNRPENSPPIIIRHTFTR